MNNGGPAFPENWDDGTPTGFVLNHKGMSLRDYLAAKAMQGMLEESGGGGLTYDERAKEAYKMADAMIEAREES